MSGRFETWLWDQRALPANELRAALARQVIYGGSLDTAILERGAMTEPAVWARLTAATGLPAPKPSLCDPSRSTLPPALDAAVTRPLRAVPVAADGETVDLLCAEPVAESAIRAAARAGGFHARLYVVPEARLLAMRQRVYGETLPARYAPLLARAVGATQARTAYVPPSNGGARPDEDAASSVVAWNLTTSKETSFKELGGDDDHPATPLEHVVELSGQLKAPTPREPEEVARVDMEPGAQPSETIPEMNDGPLRLELIAAIPRSATIPEESVPRENESGRTETVEPAVIDAATDALCRRARDPGDKGRTLAMRALRRRLSQPATQALVSELKAAIEPSSGASEAEIVDAISGLTELRDASAVRALIARLDGAAGSPPVARAARQGLVILCAQDFGSSQRPWQTWAQAHANRHRVEWLLEGLAHKRPEIRKSAIEDLRQLAGDSFGYVFDGPKRAREAARGRFVSWWQTISRPERLIPVEPTFLGTEGDVPLPHEPNAR